LARLRAAGRRLSLRGGARLRRLTPPSVDLEPCDPGWSCSGMNPAICRQKAARYPKATGEPA
jgi:hypothetical protein